MVQLPKLAREDWASNQLAGKVPNTRLVNGKDLSSDVTLTAADVGADAALHGTAPVRSVVLVAGAEGESAVGSGATVTTDTVRWETGGRAWKVVSNAEAIEARLRVTPTDAPLTFPAAAAVCARVYVPDASKYSSIRVDIYGDAALTFADRWSRTATTIKPLVDGWNTLRFPASVSTRAPGKWGAVYRVDVVGDNVGSVAGNEFTVDRVWVECPKKATLSFIEDHCSVNFLTHGYPGLKSLGVPVYWALNPEKLGLAVVDQGLAMTRMNEAQIESVAWENRNLVGAHAWGDLQTADMTPEQIRADALRTTKWLQARGYTGWVFRPAWWQEMATNYAAAQPFYLGMATYKADSGITCWPPPDMYNIPRYHLYQNRTLAQIDALFADLYATRQHVNLFTHMVAPLAQCGIYDTDLTTWDYLLGKIADAITDEWLEPVNWLDMWTRAGGRFRQGVDGSTIAEFYRGGGLVTQVLP